MSSLTNPLADLDFWEFVSCAKCHLPYASDPGRSVPFWLTECGHVVCNNHLNPDQSCALCESTRIQLVPLQQQLDAPMVDWFRSIPMALDSIAFAAKFQQEVMARQIKFYRSRHQQIRTVIEKLRSEIMELKRANELLLQENEQLKKHRGYQQFPSEGIYEPSAVVNHNGKRPFGVSYRHEHHPRPRTDSSPIHVSTTPNRLTLPAGKQAPGLIHPGENTQYTTSPQAAQRQPVHGDNQGRPRPMSKHIEKFAYIPPETPRDRVLSFSGAELAPGSKNSQTNTQGEAGGQLKAIRHTSFADDSRQTPFPRLGTMGPPPTPQARNTNQSRLSTPAMFRAGSRQFVPQNRRFLPPQSNQQEQDQPRISRGPQGFFSGSGLAEVTSRWEPNPGASKEPRAHPC